MDINQVIEAGKNIVQPEFVLFSDMSGWAWFWVIGLFILGLILLLVGSIEMGDGGGFVGFMLICISGIVILYHACGAYSDKQTVYDAEVEKWKNEIAIPYIESQEILKNEIVFIKIDPEMGTKVTGSSFLGSGYTYSSTIEKTPLTVSYKDGKNIITQTDWIETSMELTTATKPYIQYQRLLQDLGHDINAGIYNAKVFLPETYTFTEIK